MYRFSRLTFVAAKEKEWLLTNGNGGFAAGTLADCNTRRYHGLLVAALPNGERRLFWSKAETHLSYQGRSYHLVTNEYLGGVIHPEGYRFLLTAEVDTDVVRLLYNCDGIILEKSIIMVPGVNATIIRYYLVEAEAAVELVVDPLVNQRDYHSITQSDQLPLAVTPQADGCRIRLPGAAEDLILSMPGAAFDLAGEWYRNFYYQLEDERGLEPWEHHFRPGQFRAKLQPGTAVELVGVVNPVQEGQSPVQYDFTTVYRQRRARTRSFQSHLTAYWGSKGITKLAVETLDPTLWSDLLGLAAAGQAFAVSSLGVPGFIAGYPWFTQWGRDTMLALPGLSLATGNYTLAREILLAYAKHIQAGLLPNRFTDAGGTAYNTVDAALWFLVALYQYWQETEDRLLVDQVWPGVYEIISSYLQGTAYNIHTVPNGLLHAGEPGVQLTWMDAKIGDWVVTPRIGYPVEINALWYNALQIGSRFAELVGRLDLSFRWSEAGELVRQTFTREFWDPDRNCLYDLITTDGTKDTALRPNQIFAVSLPFLLISREKASAVVEQVRRYLYTPGGLRSLAPGEPQYHPRYAGNPRERDAAYHQGTSWAWLTGPFITAYLRVNQSTQAALTAKILLDPLRANLTQAGIGQISEIFEPEYPYTSQGCPAQAWSVAELLRAYIQEILPLLVTGD